jgi:hypothetical protein
VDDLVDAAAGLISVLPELRPLDRATYNAGFEVCVWRESFLLQSLPLLVASVRLHVLSHSLSRESVLLQLSPSP